jgi:hypothetical protein
MLQMEVVGVVVEVQATVEAVAAGQNAVAEVAVQELVHKQTAQRRLQRPPMSPGERLFQPLHGTLQPMEPSKPQLRLDGMMRPAPKPQLLQQLRATRLPLQLRVRLVVGLVFLQNHHLHQRKLLVRLLLQSQKKPHRLLQLKMRRQPP